MVVAADGKMGKFGGRGARSSFLDRGCVRFSGRKRRAACASDVAAAVRGHEGWLTWDSWEGWNESCSSASSRTGQDKRWRFQTFLGAEVRGDAWDEVPRCAMQAMQAQSSAMAMRCDAGKNENLAPLGAWPDHGVEGWLVVVFRTLQAT